MKKYYYESKISEYEFESYLKLNTHKKTLSSTFAQSQTLLSIDKKRKTFVLVRTGAHGISGGQLYFYGSYVQRETGLAVRGRFALPRLQLLVLILFISLVLVLFFLCEVGSFAIIPVISLFLFVFLIITAIAKVSGFVFRSRSAIIIELLDSALQ